MWHIHYSECNSEERNPSKHLSTATEAFQNHKSLQFKNHDKQNVRFCTLPQSRPPKTTKRWLSITSMPYFYAICTTTKRCNVRSYGYRTSTSSSRTWTAGRFPWSGGVASRGQMDHTSERSPSMSLGRNCPLPCSNAHGTRPDAHNTLEELLQHQEQINLQAQTWKPTNSSC